MEQIEKKAALAVIQSGAPYNLFENKIMKSLLSDLLTAGQSLTPSAKKKLVEDLSNRKKLSEDVDDLCLLFQTVC